jgi:F-type H+-transporting ATPase subunit delta
MKDRKLATRYARALLGALPDAGHQTAADEFLSALAGAVRGNAELRAFLLDPAAPVAAKKSFLGELAAPRGVPERVLTFLGLLLDNGRIANLPSIAEVFHSDHESGQGIVSAVLTAAAPLPPELRSRAVTALEKLARKKVNLTVKIDPSLLGGAVAQVGSVIYDGSLKTQLSRLRDAMGKE